MNLGEQDETEHCDHPWAQLMVVLSAVRWRQAYKASVGCASMVMEARKKKKKSGVHV